MRGAGNRQLEHLLGPRQVLPPRIFDADLRDLLLKTSTEVVQDYESAFPSKTYAEVVIETAGGETFSSGRMEPRWEAPDTLPSDGELEAKFRWLVNPVLGEERCERLMATLRHFEGVTDASILVRLCGPSALPRGGDLR